MSKNGMVGFQHNLIAEEGTTGGTFLHSDIATCKQISHKIDHACQSLLSAFECSSQSTKESKTATKVFTDTVLRMDVKQFR